MDILKSINYKQEDIIADIIKLHIPSGQIEVDLTYSKGQFYKSSKIKQPLYKYDMFPLDSSIKPYTNFWLEDEDKFGSIMIDFPFVITVGGSLGVNNKSLIVGSNITANRFSGFKSWGDLKRCYSQGIQLAYLKLKQDGILIFKTQRTVSGGKQHLTPFYSIQEALRIGFYPIDEFILCSKGRISSGKWKKQWHSRAHHSSFLVFKKCKQKVDYSSKMGLPTFSEII